MSVCSADGHRHSLVMVVPCEPYCVRPPSQLSCGLASSKSSWLFVSACIMSWARALLDVGVKLQRPAGAVALCVGDLGPRDHAQREVAAAIGKRRLSVQTARQA